jgi:hypothetical protein
MALVADFAWTKGDHLINKYESSKVFSDVIVAVAVHHCLCRTQIYR